MDQRARFHLWQIEEIEKLSDEISVVRNIITGEKMLRRVSPAESYSIMEQLCSVIHPNLMRVYDAEVIGNRCVSLCEFIDGHTLEQIILSQGVCSEKDARVILASVCSGLSVLHQKGIVHRDINPSNVMMDQSGTVKIVDYDIVRTYKEGQPRDTYVIGTAGYAAPEQFGFLQTDAGADIFSCGVLLNFLLTGCTPKERLCEGELRRVVERCIEIDPRQRYESAEHLKAAVTNDRRYFRKHQYDDIEQLRFRPIPGFRTKHIFPKILTVLGITVYTIGLMMSLILFTAPLPKHYSRSLTDTVTMWTIFVIVFGFWSLFPYLLFGDIGESIRGFSPTVSLPAE